ncbi:fibronectin type III domain-containing protein [Saccharothrix yanglingensis]|uniref:Fibronectin type-III domain-containing protein n=1 Tax=Saccharothrix yanglingensis TaxID=659496 RepID=A0ABU0WTT4_9PSEU|nr:fibronectin type III domain-containing protein [Saccharothrix yanglingensis]MDQ2583246.1 hypothetical protein [Saccharothrix yanglingensis]
MDRRRIALVAAGVVLFAGVIAVLRTGGDEGSSATTTTSAPPPTSLAPFAAEGVLVPKAGEPPAPPGALTVSSGPRRLQLRWTGDAPGYEVRWGQGRTKFVTDLATQLDGLENDEEYRVEVLAVDAHGRRSAPAKSVGTPRGTAGDYELEDRFDQPDAPDPTRWRLASRGDCARATPGRGDDGPRLVISNNCAASPATLRSRTPFRLDDGSGRLVVETDAPGPDGELLLDLVPGPVTLVGGDVLPPGAVRLRVATGNGSTSVRVLTPDGAATTEVRPVAALEAGISHRWELELGPGGARVVLDGDVVATSPSAPAWTEATALVSAVGPTGQRAAFSLIAFDGAPASPPPLVPGPGVEVVTAPDAPASAPTSPPPPGVTGGRLRLAVLHTDESPQAPPFTLAVGGAVVPLRPAVEGAPWRPSVPYPLVADLPAEVLGSPGGELRATLVTGLRVQVSHVDLELAGTATGTPPATRSVPPAGLELKLARVTGTVLDASGQVVPEGAAVRRGRLVLDLLLTSRPGEPLAGMAGFSLRVDDERVAVVPTAEEGPGIAGKYRFALNTSGLSPGPHMIEVRLFGTSAETRATSAFVPFFLGR